MAYQDSFAAPLAKKLVDKFRVTSLSYTRVSDPAYDPSTGVVTPGETTYPSAGAVYPSFVDKANGGPSNSIQIEVEICLADVGNIVLLLSREFVVLVLIANVIAWPVSYLMMDQWLDNFATRISIGFPVFLLAGFLVLLIAVVTVGYKTLITARSNPVTALRYE